MSETLPFSKRPIKRNHKATNMVMDWPRNVPIIIIIFGEVSKANA
jgi:hypothetical protein